MLGVGGGEGTTSPEIFRDPGTVKFFGGQRNQHFSGTQGPSGPAVPLRVPSCKSIRLPGGAGVSAYIASSTRLARTLLEATQLEAALGGGGPR